VPLADPPPLRSVIGAQFVEGPAGPRGATAFLRLSTEDGRMLAGKVTLTVDAAGVGTLSLKGIHIDDVPVADRQVTARYPVPDQDAGERLTSLLELLKGDG
jgi:hypothetical protein